MLEKKISYIDLNGNEQTDTYLFNYTKREATKLFAKYDGDIMGYITKLIDAGQNGYSLIIDMIEDIILGAVGHKSPDGKAFVKSPEFREQFEQTVAYAELFDELLTDKKAMEEFASKVVPQNVAKPVEQPATPQLEVVQKAPSAEEELAKLRASHPELFQN